MKKQKNHSEIYKIDGVGVNLEKFYPAKSIEEKNKLRKEKGFSEHDFILIYTAEFIPRKNHKLLFDILPVLKNKIPELKIILCGKGELLEFYKKFSSENNLDFVTFTGYTTEVSDYCRLSDVLFMPSHQEGLSIGMIEAIATGIPVICSNIRGHTDVIEDCVNGILCENNNPESFIKAVLLLYKNPELRNTISLRNIEKAKQFSLDTALSSMAKIYETLM